jgi:hypothetical protein
MIATAVVLNSRRGAFYTKPLRARAAATRETPCPDTLMPGS